MWQPLMYACILVCAVRTFRTLLTLVTSHVLQVRKGLFPNHRLNADAVGQTATKLGTIFGLDVPEWTKVLIGEVRPVTGPATWHVLLNTHAGCECRPMCAQAPSLAQLASIGAPMEAHHHAGARIAASKC